MSNHTVTIRLKQAVPRLGQIGQLARVNFGYARNFLLPRGVAELVSGRRAAVQLARQRQIQPTIAPTSHHQAVQTIADALAGQTVTLSAAANADGKLFASIQADDVATALKTDPIFRMEPIKQVGEYEATLDFGHDIMATVTVIMTAKSARQNKISN